MTDNEYVMISMNLIFKGSEFQRKCVLWYMNNLQSNEDYIREIKLFIDTQIRLGKLNLEGYWVGV